MRIRVSLVIEMTDEQVRAYANEYGLEARAKDVADDVRENILGGVQGQFEGFANVTIKR